MDDPDVYLERTPGPSAEQFARSQVRNAQAPEPLFAAEEHGPPVYPLAQTPRLFREAVEEAQGFVQCPVSLAANSALGYLALAVQGLVNIARTPDLTGPVSLFCVTLAPSGERKSAADDLFGRPIARWARDQQDAAAPDVAAWQAACRVNEAKHRGLEKALERAVAGTGGNGKPREEIERELRELDPPRKPRVPAPLTSDFTADALTQHLAGSWPSVLVSSAEAGVVFGGHAMKKDQLLRTLGIFNDLHSGAPVYVNRATKESFTLLDARLSMGLALQPEALRSFVGDAKGLERAGFLGRWCLTVPQTTQGTRLLRNQRPLAGAVDRYSARLCHLMEGTQIVEGRLELGLVTMTSDAHAVWADYHDTVETELGDDGRLANCRDVASKNADLAARIAALFHVLEHGPGGAVGEESAIAGCAVARFHLEEARRFISGPAASQLVQDAEHIEEWIRSQGGEVLFSHLSRRIDGGMRDGRGGLKERFYDAWQLIVEKHRGSTEPRGNGTAYLLHPDVASGDA
jgi:hypothetical protein